MKNQVLLQGCEGMSKEDAAFDRLIDFMVRMVEKYGSEIETDEKEPYSA